MKIRTGFVSNSSSTSFMITNTSDETRTLVDFATENASLLAAFLEAYDWYKKNSRRFNQEQMLADALAEAITWRPGETRECTFGDEDGTTIGLVYDYILRNGGESESFTWRFHEFLR